jgi:hypothetical protein
LLIPEIILSAVRKRESAVARRYIWPQSARNSRNLEDDYTKAVVIHGIGCVLLRRETHALPDARRLIRSIGGSDYVDCSFYTRLAWHAGVAGACNTGAELS